VQKPSHLLTITAMTTIEQRRAARPEIPDGLGVPLPVSAALAVQ
jgi:hypothetical protein